MENDGQLDINDWLVQCETLRPACKIEHPVIQKLAKECFELIKGKKRDEDYVIWDHVPKLGKRYQCWYDDAAEIDINELEAMKERYKRYDLELSFDSIPRTNHDGSEVIGQDIFVSSMWKNHKEPKIECTHTKECITFCIGCNGITYWCKRYDKDGTA